MPTNTLYASVRDATGRDRRTAVDVLGESFAADALAHWLFPEPGSRARLQADFHRSMVEHPGGELYLAGRDEGAALWLTLPAGRTPQGPSGRAARASTGGAAPQADARNLSGPSDRYEPSDPSAPGDASGPGETIAATRLDALGRALASRHPIRGRHLYLWCMGVVERRRGGGLGSAMLRHRLSLADAERLPAYLEASSVRSRDFYRRFGFEPLGDPVRLDDAPPLWPMYRESRL